MKKITILAATLAAFVSSNVLAAEVTTASGAPVGTAASGSVSIDTGNAPVEKPAEPVKTEKKKKAKKKKAAKPAEKKAEPAKTEKKIELKKEAPAAATTAPATTAPAAPAATARTETETSAKGQA